MEIHTFNKRAIIGWLKSYVVFVLACGLEVMVGTAPPAAVVRATRHWRRDCLRYNTDTLVARIETRASGGNERSAWWGMRRRTAFRKRRRRYPCKRRRR